jgi:hypothetical protein
MRDPETEAEPVESAFAQGFRAEIPPEASLTQGIFPVTGWTTRNPDEKIVPAGEHSRLTNRKSTDAAPGRALPSQKAHMDGQRMKENKDAL